MNAENRLETMRHSASHVMAEAVLSIFPDVKFGIGPSIADGFYYDFDLPRTLTPEDLPVIEAKMADIIKADLPFKHREITKAEAKKLFASQPYKLELIDEIQDDRVGIYEQGSFVDLCRGPHLKSTGEIKAFKLTSTAGAYWRGNERFPMLQRIYGIAFNSPKEMKEHLVRVEEAKKRDHRKLGRELDLFLTPDEIGGGLVIYTPKGGRIRNTIEDFWKQEHFDNGYEILYTPHIGLSRLWEISGHLDHYKENMYSPMTIDEQEFYIKPMNCPFHILVYKSRIRSYRELPLRWAEQGILTIDARRFRTQERNRRDAVDRLVALIRAAATAPKPRRKTTPTVASVRRRLNGKRRRSDTKHGRRRVNEID